jgi:hypothetical protein
MPRPLRQIRPSRARSGVPRSRALRAPVQVVSPLFPSPPCSDPAVVAAASVPCSGPLSPPPSPTALHIVLPSTAPQVSLPFESLSFRCHSLFPPTVLGHLSIRLHCPPPPLDGCKAPAGHFRTSSPPCHHGARPERHQSRSTTSSDPRLDLYASLRLEAQSELGCWIPPDCVA